MAGIGDSPSSGPSRDVGSPYGPWMGPSVPSAPQRRSVHWTLPVREDIGLRRLQAQAAVLWSAQRQLGWVLMPPAVLGRFQSIRWPQKQGLRLEPQRLTRPEAALTAGNVITMIRAGQPCPLGTWTTCPVLGLPSYGGHQGHPSPVTTCLHWTASLCPCHPGGPRPSRWAFPVASGWGGQERAVSYFGRSQQPGKNLPTEKVCFITFLPFVLVAPRTGPGPGPSRVSFSAELPVGTLALRGPGELTPCPWGLTLASPWPHLHFTDTNILEAKATREERLNGSRSRTL